MSNLSRFPGTTLRADRLDEAADEAVDNIDPCFDNLCRLLNEAALEAVKARETGVSPMAADEIDNMISDALTTAEGMRRIAEEEAAASVRSE